MRDVTTNLRLWLRSLLRGEEAGSHKTSRLTSPGISQGLARCFGLCFAAAAAFSPRLKPLERLGYHKMPQRGRARTPLILLFMSLPTATTHQDGPPRSGRR